MFNKENYNSVSQPCISKDYVINDVLIAVVFHILTYLHYTNLRGAYGAWRTVEGLLTNEIMFNNCTSRFSNFFCYIIKKFSLFKIAFGIAIVVALIRL